MATDTDLTLASFKSAWAETVKHTNETPVKLVVAADDIPYVVNNLIGKLKDEGFLFELVVHPEFVQDEWCLMTFEQAGFGSPGG